MKKQYQIILNVGLPIVAGLFIYFTSTMNLINRQVLNFLPDGLWAYAFTSCILIIWDNKVNFIWLTLLGCFFIVFELFQSFHFIKGTGDLKDIFIYFAFGLFALTINNFLKPKVSSVQ